MHLSMGGNKTKVNIGDTKAPYNHKQVVLIED